MPSASHPPADRSGRTPSEHQQKRAQHVARILASVAGYVDAVGYVALFKLFTAHQSGNSAGLGVALGTGEWAAAWRRGTAIGAFLVGLAVGASLLELARVRHSRSPGTVVTAAEIAALVAALVVGHSASHSGVVPVAETAAYAATAACLASAMGLQTVGFRRISQDSVRTTFVTGVLTDLVESFLAARFRRKGDEGRGRLQAKWRLLASIWLLYLGGAVAGALAQTAWSFLSLLAPIAVALAVAAWQYRAGYEPGLPDSAPA